MDEIEFVDKLASLAPEKSVLLNCGYQDGAAERHIKTYKCLPRQQPLDLGLKTTDPMLKLIAGWDLVNVHIGPVEFQARPSFLSDCLEFGTLEVDHLAYQFAEQDYVVLGHRDRKRRYKVAANGGALLEGLIKIRSYYALTTTDVIDIDDEEAGLELRTSCLMALGGFEYETFCTMMFGF